MSIGSQNSLWGGGGGGGGGGGSFDVHAGWFWFGSDCELSIIRTPLTQRGDTA
jgi:hypothetical protein